MIRRALVMLIGVTLIASARPRAEETVAPVVAEVEPVNLNRATLEELLEIPGLDADLARWIVGRRARSGPFRSPDELTEHPGISAARLAELEPWLFIDPAGAGSIRRASATAREDRRATGERREARVTLAGGWFGGAARWRAAPGLKPGTGAITGVLRLRPANGLSLSFGDLAPARGAGLGCNLRSGFGGSSRVEVVGAAGAGLFELPAGAALDRAAPSPEARRLRGVGLGLGSFLSMGLFDYHAGATAPAGAASRPPRIALAECGGRRADGRFALRCRGALWQGRLWPGAEAGLGGRDRSLFVEWASDPAGHHRGALLTKWQPRRGTILEAWHSQGAPRFVSLLAGDSEVPPSAADDPGSGRNGAGRRSGLLARGRLTRRATLEGELASAIDPATERRAWDRLTGSARLRLDLTPARGWALAMEGRTEGRPSTGPSEAADAPWRRHTGRLVAGWEGEGRRFRLEWRGQLTLEPPLSRTGPGRLVNRGELLAVRGRWPLHSGLWLGGGISRFDLPSDGLAMLGEERPPGVSAGVTVRGRGRRAHLALGGRNGRVEGGLYFTAEVRPDRTVRREGGGLIQFRIAGR